MSYYINQATVDDLDNIISLQAQAYSEDIIEPIERFESIVNDSEFCLVLQADSAETIGYLLTHRWHTEENPPHFRYFDMSFVKDSCTDTSILFLHDVTIHPKYRRKGLGQKMYQYFEQTLPRSCKMVCLVAIDRDARAFWQKQGFVGKECDQDILRSYSEENVTFMVKRQ